eukprot:scaffold130440_cov48-Phaeocystis_antarctica.AAC.3
MRRETGRGHAHFPRTSTCLRVVVWGACCGSWDTSHEMEGVARAVNIKTDRRCTLHPINPLAKDIPI